MPDGAAPGGIRKKRQSMAAKRIIWAMRQEIEKAEPPLTEIGFELLGRPEQLRRIIARLKAEGVPETGWPTPKTLKAFWDGRPSALPAVPKKAGT